jgi:hypothetical protein
MKRLLLLLVLCACSGTAPLTTTTSYPTTTSTTSTTVITTTTSTTSTTTTVVRTGYCPQWHELALSVGWPEEELPTLDKVMWRESRCTPDAYSNSNYGLTQINQIHKDWVRELGWNYPDDLYDPAKNLRFAYLLWADDGWKHWKTSR